MFYVKEDKTFFISYIVFLIAMTAYGLYYTIALGIVFLALYVFFCFRRNNYSKITKSIQNIYANVLEIPPKALLKINRITLESNANIIKKANTIIRTLKRFGIEIIYVEARRSPTITQLLFKLPKESNVKLNKILNHREDLKLALRTGRISFTNVVEKTDCFGIEVPRETMSKVGLLNIFNDAGFQSFIKQLNIIFSDKQHFINGLPFALGYNIMGEPLYLNITKTPHILIAGSTNSGKTSCIHALINSLIFYHTPKTLQLYLVDGKNTELNLYEQLPHLKQPVAKDFNAVNNILEEVFAEVQRRNNLLNESKKRDILSYNESVTNLTDALPFIVLIIDEYAEIIMQTTRNDANFADFQNKIVRLGQSARSAGIHLILSTQRPDKTIVTQLLKANIPTRIAFQVPDKTNSQIIIDKIGAENLAGKGDGYLLFESKLIRFQGTFVEEVEIHNTLDWYNDQEKFKRSFKPTATSAVSIGA